MKEISRFLHKNNKTIKDTANEIIKEIKRGDNILREVFIKNYKPYIKKIILEMTNSNSFNELESLDEFSIGLIAFNEAIDRFDQAKGVHFLTYASLVIKSRLINYLKKETRLELLIESDLLKLENNVFESNFFITESSNVSNEIDLFKRKLQKFNITFEELIQSVPKHLDSKNFCINIANQIANHKEIFDLLDKKNVFSKSKIIKLTKVNKKTIERNRKFIIAATLIIGNGFYSLKSFVDI